jgi:hypothetical protein
VHAVQLACRRVHALSTTVNSAAHVAVSGSLIRAKAPAYSIQPSASLLARLHTNAHAQSTDFDSVRPSNACARFLHFRASVNPFNTRLKPFQFWLFSLCCILVPCWQCCSVWQGCRRQERVARDMKLLVSKSWRSVVCRRPTERSGRCAYGSVADVSRVRSPYLVISGMLLENSPRVSRHVFWSRSTRVCCSNMHFKPCVKKAVKIQIQTNIKGAKGGGELRFVHSCSSRDTHSLRTRPDNGEAPSQREGQP